MKKEVVIDDGNDADDEDEAATPTAEAPATEALTAKSPGAATPVAAPAEATPVAAPAEATATAAKVTSGAATLVAEAPADATHAAATAVAAAEVTPAEAPAESTPAKTTPAKTTPAKTTPVVEGADEEDETTPVAAPTGAGEEKPLVEETTTKVEAKTSAGTQLPDLKIKKEDLIPEDVSDTESIPESTALPVHEGSVLNSKIVLRLLCNCTQSILSSLLNSKHVDYSTFIL